MRSVGTAGRIGAIGAVVIAVIGIGVVFFGATGGTSYQFKAEFVNAGQLVKGNQVMIGGVKVGSVKKLQLTPDSHALVTMQIKGKYAPLHQGTKAIIQAQSLSGIANRVVELRLPAVDALKGPGEKIPSGGTIGPDNTQTAVNIDQVFNIFDPAARYAVQQFLKGSRNQFNGQGEAANRGLQYLNPALSTSRQLFDQLNADEPLLERFVVDSARFMTAVASRHDEVVNLLSNLNTTTGALASQKEALAESIAGLPPLMRSANTTFVNLRHTLDDVDPLVNASKPVAKKLPPFLRDLRPFARDARPTVRDLDLIVKRPGPSNDLIELNRTFPPLASTALDTKSRSVELHSGKPAPVGRVEGAFPAISKSTRMSATEIAKFRPYSPDLVGWFEDFSDTGQYDALGAISRVENHVNFNTSFSPPPSLVGQTPMSLGLFGSSPAPSKFAKTGQFDRCPGGAEVPAPDGTNVLSPDEQAALTCKDSDRGDGLQGNRR